MSNKRKHQTLIINYFTTPATSSLPSDETETNITIKSNGNKRIRIEVSDEKEETKEIPPKKEKLYKCTKCLQRKPASLFCVAKKNVIKKIDSQCKACYRLYTIRKRSTLKGALEKLILSAKKTAKLRGDKGREEASQFTITYNDLLEKYNHRDGSCYYMPTRKMSFISGDKYHMSLERLDPNKGYCKENVVLCCAVFNCYKTWTMEKIQLLKLISKGVIMEPVFSSKAFLREFNIRRNKGGVKPLRGFVKVLSRSTKKRSNRRSKKKHRINEDHTATLTVEDIKDFVIKQEGKCAISGKKMVFKDGSDWQCSVDRIDNAKGYTKENARLICCEFQTGKTWSPQLFDEWMQSLPDPIPSS